MLRFSWPASASVLACVLALPVLAAEGTGAQWSYEGTTGPAHWGTLSPAYDACEKGQQQSPIDLTAAVPAMVAPPELTWVPFVPKALVHDGHALNVVTADDAGGMMLGRSEYTLKGVHFHSPSEHTINGQRFPLEAHFVHAAGDGRLAVIGVLFTEGEADATLDSLWTHAPTTRGEATPQITVDPAALLPNGADAFHYAGSLTTPPCSETVSWTVLATPRTASAQQLAAYQAVFGSNARPVQPRHRRFILKTH